MAARITKQIKLLLWKNFKLITGHFHMLALCVIIASALLMTMLIYRFSLKTVYYQAESENLSSLTKLHPIRDVKVVRFGISYSPENEYLGNIVKYAASKLNLPVLALPSEYILERHLMKNHTIAGIVFEDNLRNINTYPVNLSYKLRLTSKIISRPYFEDDLNWHLNERHMSQVKEALDKEVLPTSYIESNFVQIQHALFLGFMHFTNSNVNGTPEVFIQKFPAGKYKEDNIWRQPLCRYIVIFIFACPSAYLSQFISVEKKQQFKIIAATMGAPNYLHWFCWFISGTIFLLCFMVALLIFYKVRLDSNTTIENTNTFLLIIYLLVYVITYVSFSFMVGIFFSDSTKVYITTFVIHAILVPVSVIFFSSKYQSMDLMQLFFLSFFMNFAAAFAMVELAYFETFNIELNFYTMYKVSIHKQFCFGYALNMLMLDFVIYLLITLYKEQLSLYYHRHWHFPISTLYELCKRRKYQQSENDIRYLSSEPDDLPIRKNIGLDIKEVGVEINNERVLKDINIKAYEGELTIIFGHNGSGKSVLAAILAGVLKPSSGIVLTKNFNIHKTLEKHRIGYCPSVDILLNELTVEEHIWLCSGLKGSKKTETEQDILKYTSALGLERNLQTKCGKLLLTDKSKVILCTALCGRPNVIICDEPARRLDPNSSRVIWNLLRMEKTDKTILVMTESFNYEIATFADKIGIIIRGELRGYGEINLVRSSVGGGYDLVCHTHTNCDREKVTNFVKKFAPSVELEVENDNEIVYLLSGITMVDLGKLISDINQEKSNLEIRSFALHLRTIEEMIISSDRDPQDESKPISFPELHLLRDHRLTKRRWRAMLFKKLVFTSSRFWILTAAVIVMCILYGFATYKIWWLVYTDPTKITFDIPPTDRAVLSCKRNFSKIEKVICQEYTEIMDKSQIIEISTDFKEYIAKKLKDSYNRHKSFTIGASIRENKIIAWYNDDILHTAAMSLNFVHNAILRAILGQSFSISLKNAPIKPFYSDQLYTSQKESFGLFYTLILAVVSPICLIDILVERTTGYKSFQLNTGLTRATYWASAMVWDYIVLLTVSFILMVSICAPITRTPLLLHMMGIMCVVFMVYGFAAITSSYLFSCFVNSTKAYAYLCVFNIITGFGLLALTECMPWPTWDQLEWILLVFPHYACAKSLSGTFIITKRITICELICIELGICDKLCSEIPLCCEDQYDYFLYDNHFVWGILYMAAVGALCLLFFFIYEISGVRCYSSCIKKDYTDMDDLAIDQSAENEAFRVSVMTTAQKRAHALVFENVSVFYDEFQALNQVTFVVQRGEVFGIAGPNGSGKSSIIKLLTLNLKPTIGDIYLNGRHIVDSFKDSISYIGYCPEGGGLVTSLTGRDALHICCLLRGIRDRDIEVTYSRVVKYLGIKKLLDTQIKYYNESNKKKLSVAMSILGNVDIILLDQPTFGCEPAAISKICDLIEILQNDGKTVIFTTSSVLEGLFLCNRIALLVNGQIFSLGSPKDFEDRLRKGTKIVIKFHDNPDEYAALLNESVSKAKRFIERTIPDIDLEAEHYGILQYVIYGTKFEDWVPLINMMEEIKMKFNIQSYEIDEINIADTLESLTYKQRMNQRRKAARMIAH